MKKEINKKEIEEKILEILNYAGYTSLSIREITLRLKKEYDIRLSPIIVKRYLLKLKKEDKII